MPTIVTVLAALIVGAFVVIMLAWFIHSIRDSSAEPDGEPERPVLDDGDRRAGGPEFRAGALAIAEQDAGPPNPAPRREARAAEAQESELLIDLRTDAHAPGG